jgi:hypothetical protein
VPRSGIGLNELLAPWSAQNMDDNRTLEEQLAHCDGRDCHCAAFGSCECGCDADWTPAEVYRLRAEVAALRKDAQRYRWLRSDGVNYYSTGIIPDLVWQGPDWHDIATPEMLDSAIDAAMSGANKNPMER